MEYGQYGVCYYKGFSFVRTQVGKGFDSYQYELNLSFSDYPNILNTLPKCSKTLEGDCLTITTHGLAAMHSIITFITNYERNL